MSQAEELLNGISEELPLHSHPVPDTDTYFIIDPITRKIENTNRKKNVIMQYDHNSERFTFELPRFIDGHDMLECTSVTVNVDNIEVVESDGIEEVESRINSDAPDMTDLRVHPNDSEKVISSWLISRNSTQLAGILSFHIEYKCVDSKGNVVYEWSTDNYDEIEIKARKKNGEAAIAGHSDLLEQWRTRIFGAGDSVMANIAVEGEVQVAAIQAESETQQEAVELKGAQTLDSIPEDYTEVDAMADEAVRTKGDAIVCEASGESIVIKDSSNDHIRGLKLFGKSVQDGEPSPDNPVGIVSAENPTVRVYGKNLLNPVGKSRTLGGVTLTNNGDGSFTVKGTSTEGVSLNLTDLQTYPIHLRRGCAYTQTVEILTGIKEYGSRVVPSVQDSDGKVTYNYFSDTDTKIADKDYSIKSYVLYVDTGRTLDYTFRVQLELDSVSTEYEPYVAQQIVAFDHTLPGIPVTSGGNYTDSDGQQWICDEIDLERGVYVQRIYTETTTQEKINSVDNAYVSMGGSIVYFTPSHPHHQNDDICLVLSTICIGVPCNKRNTLVDTYRCYAPAANLNAISIRYPVSVGEKTLEEAKVDFAGATISYVLATPIETPLTAGEIIAFKALRTNYPNTTILNDAGAWMSVKYNADTKSYIENPRVLKLVDSSTGVVYELKIVNGNLTVNPV